MMGQKHGKKLMGLDSRRQAFAVFPIRSLTAPRKMGAESSSGFSMIEMAMVLVVFSLVMGGLLGPLSAQYEQRRRAKTMAAQQEILQALYGFAMSQTTPRLPCPDADGDGLENRPCGSSGVAVGELPWATLGVARDDAWGNAWGYGVSRPLTGAVTLTSAGGVDIQNADPSVAAVNNMAAVVISGARLAYPLEQENRDGDKDFIQGDYSEKSTHEFDDLVVWISPNILKDRLVKAGKLP